MSAAITVLLAVSIAVPVAGSVIVRQENFDMGELHRTLDEPTRPGPLIQETVYWRGKQSDILSRSL